MMSMHFPYGNTNTTGQRSYGTAVCPSFGINYNPYFSPVFFSNPNGLLPTSNRPLTNRECKELVPQPLLTSSFPIYGSRQTNNSTDFLTFIEQKTQGTSELNPYANEFSLGKNSSNPFVSSKHEKISSYKLIFDDLIEKSLQSIDAIQKASKITSHHHISTQCEQSIDQINRSTQTHNDYDHFLLEEYSSSAVKLMGKLKCVLEISSSDPLNSLCEELYQSILVINHLIRSNQSSIDRDNLFNNQRKDFSIPSSPMNTRRHRLISSTPSISSEMIDPLRTNKRSKPCLLCRKPLDHHDDLMHQFCRLFSGMD